MRLKNKKGAKEKVSSSNYVIKEPKLYKSKWNKVFENNNPIYIEIGMGRGDFIINNSIKYPNINFIGIEMYDSVLYSAINKLEKLQEDGIYLSNLKLIRMDANEIEDVFINEIDRIYLNFSDPWPKAKHYKRRLTSNVFLSHYDKIFKDKKEIIQKTDNEDLFEFSINSLKEYGYDLKYISRDLYNEQDYDKLENIPTEYEEKFKNQGIKIKRLVAYM